MRKGIKGVIATVFISVVLNIKVVDLYLQKNIPSNVILEGNEEGLVFIPSDEAFLWKNNMLPGDTVKRTMIIRNDYDETYEIYMRAERVTTNQENDLFDKLQLTIEYDEQIIYKGLASGEANLLMDKNLVNDISLGSVRPGESKILYAEVTLDGPSIGNEYKNKVAQVDWIFTAITHEDYETPKTGDSTVIPYIILALLSILYLIIDKKRENNNMKHNKK